mgnify:CR=1 FL=1
MKVFILILLGISIIVVGFVWLLFLSSSHNVPSKTHLTYGLLLLGLLICFVLLFKNKRNTQSNAE